MDHIYSVASICGALLIIFGELLAFKSVNNLKRLLIFSTIAELGYFLIGIGVPSVSGLTGAALHLLYQTVIRSLAFSSASRLANEAGSWELGKLKGIHQSLPYTALFFGFSLFSFMGLSPFKGTLSKFMVTYAAMENGDYLIAASATLGTIIAAMYLIRVIQTICFETADKDSTPISHEMHSWRSLTSLILMCLAATMTIFPEPFIHACEEFSISFLSIHGTNGLPHFENPWSVVVLIPYLGAFVVLLTGRISIKLRNCTAIATALISLGVIYNAPLLDAFSGLAALVFAFITTLVVIYSVGYLGHKAHSNRYFFFLFLMYGSLVGVATATHLGNFYMFWELMTWTSYLLVIHKQTQKALRAGYTYFIMCVSGATIMHYGILLWHTYSGTFEISALTYSATVLPATVSAFIAVLFFIGLGVKAGLFPMHAWLPNAHPVAPSSISAPMSGILTKAGVLGLIKFLPIFAAGAVPFFNTNSQALLPNILMGAGAATLILGELMALRQNDIKRMLAYSTLAQVGEIVLILSINTWITTVGALGHVVNHAIMKDLLFLAAGSFILRAGSQQIDRLSGLGRKMPITGLCFVVGILAIMGLPPFNGFISKFMMLHAAIQAGFYPIAALILTGGLIGSMYYGRLLKVLFFQKSTASTVKEAPGTMRFAMGTLASLCVLFGLWPQLWQDKVVLAANAIWGVATATPLPDLTIQWPLATIILLIGTSILLVIKKTKVMGCIAAATVLVAACAVLFEMDSFTMHGMAFTLVLLVSAALNFIYAAKYMDHSHTQWRFFATCMVMVLGLTGLALSASLFSFFAFWEIMSSWPLFFAIIHEESSEALKEGTKYFLFNLAGASLLFLGILLLGNIAGTYDIKAVAQAITTVPTIQWIIPVALMAIGFLMKAAMIPLRIDWQMHPATAPTPISGYISAVLLKSAPFGLLILFYGIGRGLLPTVEMHHLMYIGAWVAALTIFFAAFMAVTQSDIKGVLIYSTVSQLGYIILGICLGTPMGIGGGLLHLINHMLFKNLAFLCAGALMYTTHAHSLNELGGIGRRMPLTTLAFGVATMSAAGVPPFNGFTSKWMLYHALIDQNEILLVLLALSGSVLTLAYFAKFLHSAFMGQLSPNHANVSEASPLMLVPMGLLACLCLITGIVPGILLTPISYIMKGLGIDALTTTISGITSTTGAWNAPLVSCMILVAFAFVAILLKLMNSKVRYTHIHMCGVTELPQELTNVTAEHVYEAPLQLIVRLKALVLAPFTKE